MVQQMHQNFWHHEYVIQLSQTPKWHEKNRNVEIDELVIITAPNTAPLGTR